MVVDNDGHGFDSGVLAGGIDMHDGVYCAGCRVPATSVRAHPSSRHSRVVAAYFRIKHKGDGHQVGCVYDFDRQVARIVDDAGPTVITKERGHYRLHLPLTGEPEQRPDRGANRLPDLGEDEWMVLSAAARIQRLLTGYEHHPEAAEEFVAEYNGHEITWGDFCWDLTQPPRVRELIDELRRPDWNEMRHPIAAWSWNAGTPTRNASGSYRLTLTRAYLSGAVARLRAEDVDAFARIDPAHRCVMGYGEWRMRTSDRSPESPEVFLRVGHASAVTSWPVAAWPLRARIQHQPPAPPVCPDPGELDSSNGGHRTAPAGVDEP